MSTEVRPRVITLFSDFSRNLVGRRAMSLPDVMNRCSQAVLPVPRDQPPQPMTYGTLSAY